MVNNYESNELWNVPRGMPEAYNLTVVASESLLCPRAITLKTGFVLMTRKIN